MRIYFVLLSTGGCKIFERSKNLKGILTYFFSARTSLYDNNLSTLDLLLRKKARLRREELSRRASHPPSRRSFLGSREKKYPDVRRGVKCEEQEDQRLVPEWRDGTEVIRTIRITTLCYETLELQYILLDPSSYSDVL